MVVTGQALSFPNMDSMTSQSKNMTFIGVK